MKNASHYEVIIIGGSYAGLAAGMALGRALRKTLIIDSGHPCNAATPYSHNFLGSDGKTPAAIATTAKQQVAKYVTVAFLNDRVTSTDTTANGFSVETEKGNRFLSNKLVFATGIKDTMLPIPGFTECWGKTVIHCPYCHGYEVRGEQTGILANGDTAFELSMLVGNWTKQLTIYTNGVSQLSPQQLTRLSQHSIAVIQSEIKSLEHTHGTLRAIQFKDGTTAQVTAIYARPLFEQHCTLPATLGCELSNDGYIKVNATQKTSVPGVFACGDNTGRMRTVANAVAQGTATSMMVNKELTEEHF